jgi:hypothetical protein
MFAHLDDGDALVGIDDEDSAEEVFQYVEFFLA